MKINFIPFFQRVISILFVFSTFFLHLSCEKAPTDVQELITRITGTVTNKVTGSAMQGVQIVTVPVTSTVTTDANGKYELSKIPAGSYSVKAIKSGYRDCQITVSVSEGGTASADIQIEELTAELGMNPSFVDLGVANNQATIALSNNTGIGAINFTISKNASWLSLSESSGTISTNVKNITLTVDREKVSFGSYNDVVTISSNVGNRVITVQMTKQNPNAPQLTISPIILDFGTAQSEQNIILSNTGTGTVNWTSSTSDGWLSITPGSGAISSNSITASVKVIRTGMTSGIYNGSLLFSSDGGNQRVTVKMQIPDVPVLSVFPQTLDFGEAQASQILQINNIGSGNLNWNISTDQPWLSVNYQSGANASAVSVAVNRSGLSQGDYSGNLSVSSNGGNQTISIKMKVPPPLPPAPVRLGDPEEITLNSLKLSWSQSSLAADEFSSYKIYRDTKEDVTESSTLVTTITNSTTTAFQVTGLSSGTTHYFRIYVVNKKGGSAGSNIVSATTEKALGSWSVAITLDGIAAGNLRSDYLFPVSENNVWVVGDEIWHYNGSNWTKDLKPSGIGTLNAVYFASPTEGWAVGKNSTVIRYNGTSWTKITSSTFPTSNNDFYNVVLTSGNDVWVSGYGAFYHFDGTNWTKHTISASAIYEMDMLNGNEIWAGDHYYLFKFNGVGWSKIASNPYTDISVFGSNKVWLTGTDYHNKSILYKFDGTRFDSGTEIGFGELYTLDFLSDSDGWATGFYDFYHYDGNTWKKLSSPTGSEKNCLKMTSANTGWAVGAKGEILRYYNSSGKVNKKKR